MAGGVEAGDAVDDGGESGALVLLDETPISDVLEPPVGDVGGDLLHGVEAEVAAVGEDRGEQGADIPGVDPLLAGLLEVDAEPEVVLGPLGVSTATPTSSAFPPVTDSNHVAISVKPAPPCLNSRSPSTAPAASTTQA